MQRRAAVTIAPLELDSLLDQLAKLGDIALGGGSMQAAISAALGGTWA